ncbi:MAG: hypothetical protein DMF69_05410 [Acidobacteria bacterium]|nr:MAG: hypothetical protein DMF69_05410 [Acidobacteriota bacterium]
MKIVVVVLFLLATPVFGQTQTDPKPVQQTAFLKVDRIGEANARSFFIFSTSIRNYAIRHDGHGESSSTTSFRKNYDLKMGGAQRLESVYFAEFEGDLLLAYEVTDLKYDWGYVLRMDQKTALVRWITPLSVSGLGPGLIEARDLYLSASNVLAKIDLQSGALLWQRQQTSQSMAFRLPVVRRDTVVFYEDAETGRTVELEKLTGRLVKN